MSKRDSQPQRARYQAGPPLIACAITEPIRRFITQLIGNEPWWVDIARYRNRIMSSVKRISDEVHRPCRLSTTESRSIERLGPSSTKVQKLTPIKATRFEPERELLIHFA